MSCSSQTEKRVITECIELWKDFRCLWDLEDKHYSNRDRRNEAYKVILEVYKKWIPDATVGSLKKKLENMRSAYKREARKIKASEITGSGSDQIYIPKLWYFEYMAFLDEKASVTGGTETLEEELTHEAEENATFVEEERETPTPNTTDIAPQQSKRARISYQKKKETLLNTAHALLASKEEKWEVIGKSLGLQLQELRGEQQDIAQKLISDVIFYGKRGRLTDVSSISLNSHYFLPNIQSNPSSASNYQYSTTPSPSSSNQTPLHVNPQERNIMNTTGQNTPLDYYEFN